MALTLSHKVSNIVPSVQKFTGKKKGDLTCDIEGFIFEVDDYLVTKPHLSEIEHLAEAKQFIDPNPEKGYVYLLVPINTEYSSHHG